MLPIASTTENEWRNKTRLDASNFLTKFWSSKLPALIAQHYTAKAVGELTCMQLSRPGWPASFLCTSERYNLEPQVIKLAKLLLYSPTVSNVQEFSASVVQIVVDKIPLETSSFARRGASDLVAQYVKAYLAAGLSENQAILRATKMAKTQMQARPVTQAESHVRSIFSLPQNSQSQLPKEDIRTVLLKSMREKRPEQQSGLGKILREALLLSHDEVRRALGEEIYSLCQPLGFVDQWKRVLVVKVSSPSAAHKAAFYTSEIIRRLKPLRGFQTLSKVRFQVA